MATATAEGNAPVEVADVPAAARTVVDAVAEENKAGVAMIEAVEAMEGMMPVPVSLSSPGASKAWKKRSRSWRSIRRSFPESSPE